MDNGKKDIGLIVAIAFASAAVSGSLVYFGMQFGGANSTDLSANVLDAQIDDAIERYVEKKQQEAEDEQAQAAADEAAKTAEMAKNVNPVTDEDHIYGSPEAKISLIEYSDFQCPYCKSFHDTAESVADSYGDDVNWVYRHYPLSFHEPAASLQAMASECTAELGGNDKFWEFVENIFSDNPKDLDGLVALAGDLGIDENEFKTCVESEKYADEIKKDTANGMAAGVKGTPGTIVLNNETGEAVLVAGAQPASALEKVIDGML